LIEREASDPIEYTTGCVMSSDFSEVLVTVLWKNTEDGSLEYPAPPDELPPGNETRIFTVELSCKQNPDPVHELNDSL
jgi:hypothetical protein|tara:strand:- start:573 stop:806 length:234 start_codon:yes stop_codon:yes gene_type:complete